MNSSAAIEAQDLVKTYSCDVRALDGIGFTVEAGTVFSLLGPNGAGKSTTVKILTTLSRADSGSARVAGHDVQREPGRVRAAIGVISQKGGVDLEATGRENLTLAGQLYGLGGPSLRASVDDLLERFDLGDAADRVARGYSGGMQRKLDVAMGLVQRPQVLFLDEPTTGLDPEARADMWTQITHLTHEEGLTILLTTHYLEEADRLARQIAILDRGKIVAEGSPDELKGQLHGDALHIELAQGDERAPALLRELDGLSDVTLEERQLHARAENGAAALPRALAALEQAGLAVSQATVARPPLDDVYLKHTGRAYEG